MAPQIEKFQRKTSGSISRGRIAKRPRQSARTGKNTFDIRTRSPSLGPSQDGSPRPDKDQTLINRKDNNDGEWTTDDESITGDDAYFHWEEEATLLSDLLEEAYAVRQHYTADDL